MTCVGEIQSIPRKIFQTKDLRVKSSKHWTYAYAGRRSSLPDFRCRMPSVFALLSYFSSQR